MDFFKTVRKTYVYALAFLLPVAVMLSVYIWMGVYPFGGKTLLTIDMTNEYVDYFSYFKSIFTGGGSLFYSFGKLFGGNMTGLFAYYLSSPFNLIFLFFDRSNFDVAILILTLLKIGLCGLTFSIYLRHAYGKNGLLISVFSIFYALMAYNIIYQLNIMWLDGVICLPLIILGIERIINRKSPVLYYLFLTFAILTNYYIGYMICIFSLLYFIYQLCISEGFKSTYMKLAYFRKRLLTFLFTSVLAGGAGAVLVIPAILSLNTSKEKFTLNNLRLDGDFKFFHIFSKVMLGSHTYQDVINGLPNIFCGLMVTILVFLFFFNRLISRREKVFSAIFLLIMLLNFYVNTLNRFWHGFNPPTWFPYRYSFMFSFLALVLGYKTITHLTGLRIRHVIVTLVLFMVSVIALASSHNADLSMKNLAVTAMLAAVYCGILVYTVRAGRCNATLLALILLPYVLVEFGYNSTETLSHFTYSSKSYFTSYVKDTESVVNGIKASDNSFYRMEKTSTRLNIGPKGNPTFNDPLMFGYNGLSHYSSTDDRTANYFLQCLGFKNNVNWAYYYRGSTPVANSLMSVKYILSQTVGDNAYDQNGYENGYYIYQNPNALPIGYMTSSNVAKIIPSSINPFDFQNKLLSTMLSSKRTDCFVPSDVEGFRLTNLRVVQNGRVSRYIKTDVGQPATIEFKIRVSGAGPQYAYFDASQLKRVQLTLNGEPFGRYFSLFDYGVLPLGNYSDGDEINLTMTLSDSETEFNNYLFYRLDTDRYNRDFTLLSEKPLNVTRFSDTYISGHVTATDNKKLLFTTIDYDKGWKVTIDGKAAKSVKVMNTLLGVNVPRGTHFVELRYTPPGFVAGCYISGISIILALLFFLALRNREQE